MMNERIWADTMAEGLDAKMQPLVTRARACGFIPYTTANGAFMPTDIHWWTNGFWPALMWQLHRMTGWRLYRDEAVRCEEMLDAALQDFEGLDHDVGFLWLIHSGVRARLEGDRDSFRRTLFAAHMLAARFNPNGFIRAWNWPEGNDPRTGWAIIDCMMNLPLLYWASRQTGDPRFRLIARAHADTAARCFVRADGSCCHIVRFDPETGEVLGAPGGQGYARGSSWSRGQAWAIYGFVLSWLCTGCEDYLRTARRVADYFISEIRGDWLPRCDFRQPAEPLIRDNAAGNIAACGLLELAKALPTDEGTPYRNAALNILEAQERDAADWSAETPAIFTKCTSAYHDLKGRHITMTYADYFFVEAISKLRGDPLLFWIPDAGEVSLP